MAAAEGRKRGELHASHADREQVIGTLKAAFVQGKLSKDEFDQRVGVHVPPALAAEFRRRTPRGILVLFLLTNLVYLCVLITAAVQVLVNWCDKHLEERPPRRQVPDPDAR